MSIPSTSFQVPASVQCHPTFEVQLKKDFVNDNIEDTIDIWDIKKVPSEFESVSKPSKVVEQLWMKKKNSHDAILNEMRENLNDIQEKCADHIKDYCHYVKMKIMDIRIEIYNIREEFENDLARYSDEGCKTVRKILMTQLERETNLIRDFQQELKDVERRRVEHVKETVIKYQGLLNEIGFISFKNSVILTNDEVQEYNQIILANHKAYETLILNMKFVIHELKEELDNWLEKIRIWDRNNL